MRLTPEERETILRFDDSGDECDVWTASPTVAARLRKAGVALTEEPGGWSAAIVKQDVRIKPGKRACLIGGTRKSRMVA